MATTSLPAPALTVRQQFARQVVPTDQPLSAFIYGPSAVVIRYANATEKADGDLGQYNFTGGHDTSETRYNWPKNPTNGVVDSDFVKLYVEKGLLRYFNDTSETALKTGSNKIRFPNHILKTGNGSTQTMGGRGVAVGDKVIVDCSPTVGSPVQFATYVAGFEADKASASQTASASDYRNAVVAGSVSGSVDAGDNLEITGSGTYVSYEYGEALATYALEVIWVNPSDTSKAKIAITSSRDATTEVDVTLGTVFNVGSRGAKATLATDQGSGFILGEKFTVTAACATTHYTFTLHSGSDPTVDRDYVVTVVKGDVLTGGAPQVQVRSVDGGDTHPPVTLVESSSSGKSLKVPLGSTDAYIEFSAVTAGMYTGDQFTVTRRAGDEEEIRTVVLAHDFPPNVTDNNTSAEIQAQFFVEEDFEVPVKSSVGNQVQYEIASTYFSVKTGVTVASKVFGGTSRLPLHSPSQFPEHSKLFLNVRYWNGDTTQILTLGPNDDLDAHLSGPTDESNPLKYALYLARLTAGGEDIQYARVGDPGVQANWQQVLNSAERVRSCYAHVPLTLEETVLSAAYQHVVSQNAENVKRYRVLWSGSTFQDVGPVISPANSSDNGLILATIDDDPNETDVQLDFVTVTSNNIDFIQESVQPGDKLRANYILDANGVESYDEFVVKQVITAHTLKLETAVSVPIAVGSRIEIHRKFGAADLESRYNAEALARQSDLVRFVLAPEAVIAGKKLPSYFACVLLAGLRSYQAPQRPLSTQEVPGITHINGIDSLQQSALDRLAASGAMILYNDHETGNVRVRHGITTGDTDVLAKREESMVSARHASLFYLVDRLEPYVGQIVLYDDIEELAQLVRAELHSAKAVLQGRNRTPELGGQIGDLSVQFIGQATGLEDTLKIAMSIELGKPGNFISASVLIV